MALPHPCSLGLNRTVLKCLAEKGKRGEEERKKRKKREREEGGRTSSGQVSSVKKCSRACRINLR